MSNMLTTKIDIPDLQEIEISVKSALDMYKGYVVTDASVKDDKRVLADLRRSKKELDDSRKIVKKMWEEPYKKFEEQAKKVISLYDEPIALIDSQIKGYEEDRKEKKKEACMKIFAEIDCPEEIDGWICYSDIHKDEWLNATYSLKQVSTDIETAFQTLLMQVNTIKLLGSEFEQDALDVLRNTGDTHSAINVIKEKESEKKRIEEEAERRAQMLLEKEKKRIEEEAARKAAEEAAREEEDSDNGFDKRIPDAVISNIIQKPSIGFDTFDDGLGFDDPVPEVKKMYTLRFMADKNQLDAILGILKGTCYRLEEE